MELSIVMPCLNEAETLETCISKAQNFLQTHKVEGEVVIADNGSTDGSQAIATRCGARVVVVEEKGYGNALKGGIKDSRGRFVIMGDADDSYDFSALGPFLEKLREGYELVMGNRFKGGIDEGAMPFLHRYLGNPVLSFLLRLFFKSSCGDSHCGLRGFSKTAYERLNLRTSGMEFASEFVVKASLMKLRFAEVPTTLSEDGRSRPPHLRTWADGWRHLWFLLISSPKWLFLYPGISLIGVGILMSCLTLPGALFIGKVGFDIHTLLYGAVAIILGVQIVAFALFGEAYATSEGIIPESPTTQKLIEKFTLGFGIVAGGSVFLVGFGLAIYALYLWWQSGFGTLDPRTSLRWAIPSSLLMCVGFQIKFSSFFMTVLRYAKKGTIPA